MTRDEEEVWSYEQRDWDLLAAGSMDGYMAFVFYRVGATGLNGNGQPFEERYRIHRTWWRTPSGWKIIEGMGAIE